MEDKKRVTYSAQDVAKIFERAMYYDPLTETPTASSYYESAEKVREDRAFLGRILADCMYAQKNRPCGDYGLADKLSEYQFGNMLHMLERLSGLLHKMEDYYLDVWRGRKSNTNANQEQVST